MRFLIKILLIFIAFDLSAQQSDMLQHKDKTHRMWKRFRFRDNRERHNKTAFNPYLEKKAKDKPSAKIARGNKKELRKQKRRAKRQLKRSKKKTGY